MLPEGWKKEKLKNVSVITTGNTPSPKNKEYYGGNIPFVSPSDLGIGKYVFKTNKYLSHKGAEVSRVVRAGSSLFTCIGSTIGKISIAGKDVVTNQQINSVSPHDRLNDDFAFYYLDFISDEISLLAGTQALPIINKSTFSGITINLPPLSEQKKIAAILSTWDRAIEGTEKLLANSQQQKKALMQQLLTGKKRLPGFTGEWEKHRLSDCCHVVMGSSPKSEFYNETGEGLPLLQGNADIKNRLSCPRIFTSEITKECQLGDILLSVRAPVGTVSIALHHACIGRGISSIRVKKGNSQEFAYQYFLSIEDRWERLAQGSTFEAVNGDDIKKLTILLPSFPEQKAIAAVLTTADEEITALESDLSRLRQEKKALMQQLLTGKRRVKVD